MARAHHAALLAGRNGAAEVPAAPAPARAEPATAAAPAAPAPAPMMRVPVPALPPESTLAPARLDPDSLTALKNLQAEGDEGFVREIIELFLEDAAKRIDDLESTLAAGSDADFTRAAHSIKGACANFGATELAKICAQIENLGREGRMAEAAPLLPGLRREFGCVRLALEAEMARL